MKKIFLVILSVITAINISSLAVAQDKQPAKVIAYYFHGTFRCPTCINMEKYSREAIDTNFKEAVDSGRLEFTVVNIEDKGNEHYAGDYQLYTKSLVLSLVKDGKEVKSKNLDKIWEYSRDKKKFIEYVTGEVDGFMKEGQ
ncbi:MAG: hypothetical protein HY761_01045 [Candidatus Omnitrophica bacterium]|nr:hypothetical protein [Candidatus Omnitrophota bacterium]